MKRSLMSLLALAGLGAVAVAADAPTRSKLACGPYFEMVKKNSARVGMKPDIVPGSWGKLPAELQKLPPGAQMCGTVMNQPTIMSPLFGKDLEAFYAPLFGKVGCQPLTCTVETSGGAVQTKCKCKTGKKLGMVMTDTGYEAYSLMMM